MKRILILITFMLVVSSDSNAQWTQMNSGVTSSLKEIYFKDASTGYCVGEGLILKTTDTGTNWTIAHSDILSSFSKVIAKDNEVICYGHRNGTRVRMASSNEGVSWTLDTVLGLPPSILKYSQNDLYVLTFSDLTRISNGNSTVINSNTFPFDVEQGKVVTVDAQGSLIKSVYPFIIWDTIYPNLIYSNCLSTSWATYGQINISEDTIIIKGTYPSAIYYSVDDGVNWSCNHGGPELNSVIVDANTVYGIGPISGGHTIMKTSDRGQNWTVQDTLPNAISSFYFFDTDHGFAVGDSGAIYRTINGGEANVTSIKNDSKLKQQIKIYPNPSNSFLKVELSEGLQVKSLCLHDMNGKQVREYRPSERNLNLEGLAQGQYLLRIETDKGVISEKVLVKN